MRGFLATAPAKLIVVGEYAVVHGGAAISAAAGVRAQAAVAADAAGWSLVNTNTARRFAFTPAVDGHINWRTDPGADGTLLAAAWRVLSAQPGFSELGPHRVELDSRDFFTAAGTKRGLGSSAAVAVALTGALQSALGQLPELATCRAVHREFQAQRGSGLDVCTSFKGGVVALTDAAVAALDWPEGLAAVPVWTGVPASTPELLGRMEAFAAAQPAAFKAVHEPLAAAAGDALANWQFAPAQQILESIYEFAACLRRFDEQTGIGIWSTDHSQLERLAEDFGLVYKPSGGGGGDYGLAFGADAERLDDFALAAAARGFTVPDFDLGVAGLQVVES